MLQSFWSSALRSLRRHPFMSAVGVLALTIALSAVLMSGLLARQELGYERSIPNHDRIYLAASGIASADRPTFYLPQSVGFLAARMRRMFPEIETIARIAAADVRLQNGSFGARERIYWADPGFFEIFDLKAVYGSLKGALRRPDSLVVSRTIAKKYFSQRNPVGETLTVAGHPARITAVIEDLPQNATLLESGVFASGAAAYSGIAECDRMDAENEKSGEVAICGLTFFKLRAGADIALIRRGEAELVRSFPVDATSLIRPTVPMLRLDQVHLFEGFNPGGRTRLAENLAIGLLILLAGIVVYVNLATARSTRRAVEVGVRKACGASYGVLVAQFLSESLLITALSGILAVSITELVLPYVNSLLNLHLVFEYWKEPATLGWFALGLAAIGILAGAYPAFLLSRFEPAEVLRGIARTIGGVSARQILVVLQCSILIGLVAGSLMIFRQERFATHEAIKLQTDEVVVIRSYCADAFVDALRKVHGVKAVTCSRDSLLSGEAFEHAQLRDGTPLTVNSVETDFGAFGLYGVRPVAGHLDEPSGDGRLAPGQRVVINEAARRALRLPSAAEAVGSPLELKNGDGFWLGFAPADADTPASSPSTVIAAVVPDFDLEAAMHPIRPTIYWPLRRDVAPAAANEPARDDPPPYDYVHVKLTGAEIPETLEKIDALWESVGRISSHTTGKISRFFVRDYIESRYRAVLQQGRIFAAFSVLAVTLSSLGFLGLAAASVERRTKEIGIRKALGADPRDILFMLLRQFASPVLWATLIAWPVSGWLISRWLQGFAVHTDLSVAVFASASFLALFLSIATVFVHALRFASAKPIAALRYE
jgi:putative ABC transport system permease protein